MISMRSKITKKLLNYYYLNPHENLFVNEISRKLDLDKRNLVKKLKELEKEGILKSEIRGNQKIYAINQTYSLFNEYKQIVFKTIGLEIKLKKLLRQTEGVKKVYLFGSYAKDEMDTHSDIDILVIGEHKVISLQKRINGLQKEINREVNIVNMDEKEFKNRIERKDPFLENILRSKHIEVI